MDIYNSFNKTYIETYTFIESFCLELFKKDHLENRPFNNLQSKILNKLNAEIQNYETILKNKYPQQFELFENRIKLYGFEDDLDRIKSVLKNEITNNFKLPEINNTELVTNLAKHYATDEILNIFRNQSSYYKLVYELKKYKYIQFHKLKKKRGEDTREYKLMMDEKYPERKTNTSLQNRNIRIEQFFDFDDNEKYLIINYLFSLNNKNTKIPLTEFMKLVRIGGTFSDLSIFDKDKKTNNITSYTRTNKGVDYYSGKSQIETLNSIIDKLKNLNLKHASDHFLRLRSKI